MQGVSIADGNALSAWSHAQFFALAVHSATQILPPDFIELARSLAWVTLDVPLPWNKVRALKNCMDNRDGMSGPMYGCTHGSLSASPGTVQGSLNAIGLPVDEI